MQFTAAPSGFTISALKVRGGFPVQGGSAATGTITTGLRAGCTQRPAAIPSAESADILAVAQARMQQVFGQRQCLSHASAAGDLLRYHRNPAAVWNHYYVTINASGLRIP